MRHTPYGYDIVDGKAVVNKEKAEQIRKICENYLSGMSFIAAAQDVGINMSHCGVKRLIQNERYLGDDFYPAILTREMANRIEKERLRREKMLGRDERTKKSLPEKLMGKAKFEEVLGAFIIKPPGKPTLVPDTDKRPAMNVTNAINEFNEIKEEK